jgi:teichuronic acid biosynthesis glycosyltransferase TuaG
MLRTIFLRLLHQFSKQTQPLGIDLVDDCSTDTIPVLHQLQFKTTEYVFKLPVNSGTEFSRNSFNTNGNYIAFLDADDVWKPHKLQVQFSSYITNVLFVLRMYKCRRKAAQ